jgi:hypothetical protein
MNGLTLMQMEKENKIDLPNNLSRSDNLTNKDNNDDNIIDTNIIC